MTIRVHVVVNPAAGQDTPVLAALNAAWPADRVSWDVSITQAPGDACRQAADAVDAGCDIVAVVGGDGTVSEVARALLDGTVPLCILPGGTGNAVAQELGIPCDVREAAELVIAPDARRSRVDVMRGETWCSLLRVGVGLDADVIGSATRELKDRFGWLAYALSGLSALPDARPWHARLTIDGRTIETECFAVLAVNMGRLGRGGARLPGAVDPRDGLSDLFIVRSTDLRALATIGVRMLSSSPTDDDVSHGAGAADDPMWHLRGQTLGIEAVDVEQAAHADGDLCGRTPLRIETLPEAIEVILPGTCDGR